jgi:Kef-type K+ transport system membrane component KefB
VTPPPFLDSTRAILVTAGAAGIDPLVQDIGVCLLVAGILSVLFERLRIPTIAALLVAGVLIGPVGLSIVTDQDRIETIAHLGLTLLLFVIGLEVNLRSLLASGRMILLTGALQVPLTVGIAWLGFIGLKAAGVVEPGYVPLYLGLACGFSSTLLVVKQLQARFQLDSISGRLSIAMLIFQDIWAIVILAVQPNFAHPEIAPVAATFGGILLVTVVAVGVARFVLPTAFRLVARMPELVVSVALAWCFGLGLFGAHLGTALHAIGIQVEVSLEMAALIAGACVASLPYSHEVVTKVTNLRDFFVTLFFVALGMGIPVPNAGSVFIAVILAAASLALRFVVFVPLLYVAGADRRLAVMTSTRLAQVSEFCLVIVYLGRNLEHVSADIVAAVIFAFVITALVTPMLFGLSETLDTRLGPLLQRLGMKPPPLVDTGAAKDDHPRLVLLGFHRLASSLIHDIEKRSPELVRRMVVIDFNVAVHDELRKRGVRVIYGDVANADTLQHAHVDAADVIISTVPDDLLKGTSNLQLAKIVRRVAPHSKIVVNAIRIADAPAMYEAGADYVFSWRTETSHGLIPAIEAMLDDRAESFREELRRAGRDLFERREIVD